MALRASKFCSKCKELKPMEEYDKSKRYKDGKGAICKECKKGVAHARYVKYAEEYRANSKLQYVKHRVKKAEYGKRYSKENKDWLLEKQRAYRKKRVLEGAALNTRRYREDAIYRLHSCIRSRIHSRLKAMKLNKKAKSLDVLGCSIEALLTHLNQSFKMRYGREVNDQDKVHIDHVWPADFATNEQEVYELCHYTNLQWLTQHDNATKSARLDWQTQYYPDVEALLDLYNP